MGNYSWNIHNSRLMKEIIIASLFSFIVLLSPSMVLAQSPPKDDRPSQRIIVEENELESFEPVETEQNSSKLIYAVIAIILIVGAGYLGRMLWIESKKDQK